MNAWERKELIQDLAEALGESRREDLRSFSENLQHELELRFGDHEPRIAKLEVAHTTLRAWGKGVAWVLGGGGSIAGFLKIIGIIH